MSHLYSGMQFVPVVWLALKRSVSDIHNWTAREPCTVASQEMFINIPLCTFVQIDVMSWKGPRRCVV